MAIEERLTGFLKDPKAWERRATYSWSILDETTIIQDKTGSDCY
jgi:hypothetical protein